MPSFAFQRPQGCWSDSFPRDRIRSAGPRTCSRHHISEKPRAAIETTNIGIYRIGDSTLSIKQVRANPEAEHADTKTKGGLEFSSPRLFIEW
jgi:hypothetical protein